MSLRHRNLKLASHFGGASVMKFAAGSSGDVPAAITIAGASTMIDLPSYLTLDHADNLYVSNDGAAVSPPTSDAILIFAPGSDGDVAPTAVISGSNTKLDLPTWAGLRPEGQSVRREL